MGKKIRQWICADRSSPRNKSWRGCLASLVLVVCQSNYSNVFAEPVGSQGAASSPAVSLDSGAIPRVPGPAGKKPTTPLDCDKLLRFSSAAPDYEPKDHFERYVVKLLQATSPDLGISLLMLFPDDVFWWIRLDGNINIISVATALHEVNHKLDSALAECNGGAATYDLLGRAIYRTEHRIGFGATPNINILKKTLPEPLKSQGIGSRYQQYIIKNAVHPSNDFSSLLEELVAYIGGADFELAVVQSPSLGPLLPQWTAIDANSGGMVDFMAYLVAYLKALRTEHPEEYAKLKSWPKMLEVIQLSWSSAEKILVETYPHTIFANKGGRLKISLAALSVAYSPEFLSELDRLGIAHKEASAWNETFLSAHR